MAQTRDGGKPIEGDVMNYKEAQGPKNRYNLSPGLPGGDNYGNCGTQSKSGCSISSSGSVGLGGDNSGNNGTQGKR